MSCLCETSNDVIRLTSRKAGCTCCPKFLTLRDKQVEIYPGNIVILNRFSSIRWKVEFGWFSYEGNRKICGWYLKQIDNPKIIKPVQETDLDDIYVVEE